jgi:hypothetical protein
MKKSVFGGLGRIRGEGEPRKSVECLADDEGHERSDYAGDQGRYDSGCEEEDPMAGRDLGEKETDGWHRDIIYRWCLGRELLWVLFVDGGCFRISVHRGSCRVVMAGLGVDGEEGGWSRHRGGRRERNSETQGRAPKSILQLKPLFKTITTRLRYRVLNKRLLIEDPYVPDSRRSPSSTQSVQRESISM